MILINQIENRINNFLGYGNINSNVWFVCMEEGFSGEQKDLETRFNATKDKVVIDIQDDMKKVVDHIVFFGNRPHIQPTWGKMIIMLLTFDLGDTTAEVVREYQKTKLGRLNSNHCILELMPLPCRSIDEKDWNYADLGVDYLKGREVYLNAVMPIRIRLFQKYIKDYRPKTVIFCSRMYLPKWSEIAGCEFKELNGFHFCEKNSTNYFVVPHPMAHGISNADWIRMGTEIKGLSKTT